MDTMSILFIMPTLWVLGTFIMAGGYALATYRPVDIMAEVDRIENQDSFGKL